MQTRSTPITWLLIAATAIGASLGMRPTHANDLLNVYRLALDNDATLQVMAQQRAASIEARPQAVAALLPHIDANGARTRDRLGYEQQIPEGNDPPTGSSGSMVDHFGNVRSYGLSLSQTLWSVEAFQRLKSANRSAAEAEARYRGAHLQLMLRVAQAYFRILSAADQLETHRAERNAFGSLLSQARSREQTGVGARSDVVQAQAFYDITEQSEIDAQTEFEDAQRALETITGSFPSRVAPLQEQIPLDSPVPALVEDWVAQSREQNPELQAASLRAEAAAHDTAALQARHLPVLELRGASTRVRQDEEIGGRQNYDSIGVQLTWPLFAGGLIASEVRESRAVHRGAQAEYELALRDTERRVRLAYRGAATGIERVAASARAVASTRTAVEQARRNVEFGTGSEFELLSAQNNQYAAQRAWHQARFDQLTQQLTLKQLAGQLDERDLARIDALLVTNATETP